MGVFGWQEIRDGVELRGIAVGHGYSSNDGDWSLFVRPDPDYAGLLVNPHGFRNNTGEIECEIDVPDAADHDDQATEEHYFSRLIAKSVVVTGTWVVDCSHRADGADLPKTVVVPHADCDGGKTEIHPITSILVELTPPNSPVKRVEFFVFSDDSSNFPATVPHSGENRMGAFVVAFPTPIVPGRAPTFKRLSEVNLADSVDLTVAVGKDRPVLRGVVHSGTHGNGFYHTCIDLSFGYRSLRVALGLVGQPDLAQGLRALHPLFNRPGPGQPISTRGVLDDLERQG